MRIRDRLIALATASLTLGRSLPRGAGARDELAPAEALAEAEAGATGTLAEGSTGELPRQLGEQMLQSIHASHQRLLQTSEALAVLDSAIATAEAAVRQHLAAARAAPPLAPPSSAQLPATPAPRASRPTTPPYALPAFAVAPVLPAPPVNLAGGVMTLALHAANARALDGSYLFTGSGAEPPFLGDGAYRGSSTAAVIILLPGPPPHLALAAAALTCLAPCPDAIDLLPRLARAQLACDTNSPRALEACREPLTAAVAHLRHLQARVAAAQAVLADALGLTAGMVPARPALGEPEPEQPAAQLAATFGALEAARSLAERTLAIFPSGPAGV